MYKSNFVKASILTALKKAESDYGDETTNAHWYDIADMVEQQAMAQAYVSEYENAADDDSDTMFFMAERARWGRAVLKSNYQLVGEIEEEWEWENNTGNYTGDYKDPQPSDDWNEYDELPF